MIKFKFTGTGGQLFAKLFVGMILTMITFGIYSPWFVVGMMKYFFSKSQFGPTAKGDLKLEFSGQGGKFFVIGLVGYLLTLITLGIYGPWFMVKLIRFYAENSVAKADDGTRYQLRFDASGGDLFVTFLVGYLLTMITFGIYGPWFMCKLQDLFYSNTSILSGGQKVGGLNFSGTGGDLFVTFIVGYLLSMITLGIYGPWFQVKIMKFYAQHTVVTVNGVKYGSDFTGTGGELFVKMLLGSLLTLLTLGIYAFWFAVDITKWKMDNTPYKPIA